jgi:hypothetical protein
MACGRASVPEKTKPPVSRGLSKEEERQIGERAVQKF